MDITFFIGNGLDVGMGLDTRYSDFYKTLSTESNNRIEKDIANKIQSSDEKDKLYWKDYELGLGEATVMYEENEFEVFKKDKSDLDHKIANYIKSQEEKYSAEYVSKNYKKFLENLTKFKEELKFEPRERLKNLMFNAEITFKFISFNYTNVLDKYIKAITEDKNMQLRGIKLTQPLHIHGELRNGYIVGLDNETQIKNPAMTEDSTMLNYLIKKNINDFLGENHTTTAIQTINNSSIICIFGMSLGETDYMWWQKLLSWLQGEKRYLIIYDYDANAEYLSGSDYVNYITEVRHRFLKAANCTDSNVIKNVFNKIFVIHNSNIFNFNISEDKENGKK